MQYKRETRGNNRSCSFGADGKLLHVVDAVFVDQTDGERRQVQDEAFVELLEKPKRLEKLANVIKIAQKWLA